MKKQQKRKILIGCGLVISLATYFLKEKWQDSIKGDRTSLEASRNTLITIQHDAENTFLTGLAVDNIKVPDTPNGQQVIDAYHKNFDSFKLTGQKLVSFGKFIADFNGELVEAGGIPPPNLVDWSAATNEMSIQLKDETDIVSRLMNAGKAESTLVAGSPEYTNLEAGLAKESKETEKTINTLLHETDELAEQSSAEASRVEGRLKSKESTAGNVSDALYLLTWVITSLLLYKFDCEADFPKGE